MKTKVALIGAGAVGSYLVWGFYEDDKVEFTVIAEGERRERLLRDGMQINGENYRPAVKTPGEAGVQDVIFLATKYQGLDGAIELLPEMIGEKTLVLSLLNGVDSEEKVASKIGSHHVIYSLIRISSQRKDRSVNFRLTGSMGIFYGLTGDQTDDFWQVAMRKLKELFAGSRLLTTVVDDIVKEIWLKYASNISNNLPQAILGLPAILYNRGENGIRLAELLRGDVRKVALAKGIDIGEGAGIFVGDLGSARYSTLQDIEAGRHTEIDMFTGVLMQMADELGIDVPYARLTHHLIKALEEKNDGLFEL